MKTNQSGQVIESVQDLEELSLDFLNMTNEHDDVTIEFDEQFELSTTGAGRRC